MILLSTILPFLHLLRAAQAAPTDSFQESLILHPLPDGKLSVLFEFTTHFAGQPSRSSAQSHHSLTPPALLLPLEQNNVSELTISFVSGQWDQRRSGEGGPLHYESGGGGGEVRGWLRDEGGSNGSAEAWERVTHALGGLFCAGLGPNDDGPGVNTFGHIYPPLRSEGSNLTHFYMPHPFLHLCTENLTPFLSLLPSKGLSGLSALLAQPGVVFSWGYKTEGIEVIMPTDSSGGRWRGWWEGVVDLVPERGGSRAFSIRRLFNKGIPRAFPEAEESVLRLIMPEGGMKSGAKEADRSVKWIDGAAREVREWDLLDSKFAGEDIRFWWDGEDDFRYPRKFTPPPITISRTVTAPLASDGTFSIRISNHGSHERSALYSEVWPWWVKGWLHEIDLVQVGQGKRPELVTSMFYDPSRPPTASSTTIHLSLLLPPRSILILKIPFSKLTLKYTEHRPDAERGREIPSGILTLVDMDVETEDETNSTLGSVSPKRSGRRRLYTSRLLLDVPTPDFSMPYNVIIMSSTVMAVFFGLMHGALTRRLGWVELSPLAGRKGASPAGNNIVPEMDAGKSNDTGR